MREVVIHVSRVVGWTVAQLLLTVTLCTAPSPRVQI